MKLALVTGASSGIGASASRHLAKSGFRVILVARRRVELAEIAAEIGPQAIVEVCDVASVDDVLALGKRVSDLYGSPDAVVHCAGAGRWKALQETTPQEGLLMAQAPYLAALFVSHIFIHGMLARRSGVIIHVNSPACLCPWPSSVGYAAARWALRGLHESLCQDLAGTGVSSCHMIFGQADGGYFEHNEISLANIPRIARVVPTLSRDACGSLIARCAEKPKRESIHPFMLRAFALLHSIAPFLVRWMLRQTSN